MAFQLGGFDVGDLKSALKKVKAVVNNYTELEMKVRDCTSSEAWGAASTDMQQLAKATFDYQGFNEVMAAIQRRMSEEGRTWRNIYKSLTLIEYLLKNGSDRVIDYWRSNTYLIKACTTYQFVDDKQKDQGINVRHRAQEILKLLSDDGTLKFEREKAAQNRSKYGGVGSDGSRSGGFGLGAGGGAGGQFGGFSSADYAASSGASIRTYPGHVGGSSSAVPSAPAPTVAQQAQPEPPKPQPVADLLGFDDAPAPSVVSATSATGMGGFGAPAVQTDDEWGDFASATGGGAARPAPGAAAPVQHMQQPAAFNAFAAPASAPMGQPAGFAAFDAPAPAPASAIAGFAAFTSAPTRAAAKPAATAAADDDDFADFAVAPPPPSSTTGAAPLMSLSPPAPAPTHLASAPPLSVAASAPSSAPAQPPKLSANAPLQAFVASGLVSLDPIAMLGGNKPQGTGGPSMNAMMSGQVMGQIGKQASGTGLGMGTQGQGQAQGQGQQGMGGASLI